MISKFARYEDAVILFGQLPNSLKDNIHWRYACKTDEEALELVAEPECKRVAHISTSLSLASANLVSFAYDDPNDTFLCLSLPHRGHLIDHLHLQIPERFLALVPDRKNDKELAPEFIEKMLLVLDHNHLLAEYGYSEMVEKRQLISLEQASSHLITHDIQLLLHPPLPIHLLQHHSVQVYIKITSQEQAVKLQQDPQAVLAYDVVYMSPDRVQKTLTQNGCIPHFQACIIGGQIIKQIPQGFESCFYQPNPTFNQVFNTQCVSVSMTKRLTHTKSGDDNLVQFSIPYIPGYEEIRYMQLVYKGSCENIQLSVNGNAIKSGCGLPFGSVVQEEQYGDEWTCASVGFIDTPLIVAKCGTFLVEAVIEQHGPESQSFESFHKDVHLSGSLSGYESLLPTTEPIMVPHQTKVSSDVNKNIDTLNENQKPPETSETSETQEIPETQETQGNSQETSHESDSTTSDYAWYHEYTCPPAPRTQESSPVSSEETSAVTATPESPVFSDASRDYKTDQEEHDLEQCLQKVLGDTNQNQSFAATANIETEHAESKHNETLDTFQTYRTDPTDPTGRTNQETLFRDTHDLIHLKFFRGPINPEFENRNFILSKYGIFYTGSEIASLVWN